SRAMFEDLLARVGVRSTMDVSVTMNGEQSRFRAVQPHANFRSGSSMPKEADVVVIGAGLTGASAAYHLIDAVRDRKLRVVVIDKGDPAGEASGRNGGNFELIPENSVGVYEGLANERLEFLMRVYPRVPLEVLRAESERQ